MRTESIEMVIENGQYVGKVTLVDSQERRLSQKVNTPFAGNRCYQKKAERYVEKQIETRSGELENLVASVSDGRLVEHTEESSGSLSKGKKTMQLIRVHKNKKLYFDFYYIDPMTKKRERCQKATGLEDNLENRIQAQQMALEHRNALLQPKQSTPTIKGKNGTMTTLQTVGDLVAYYVQRPKFTTKAKKTQQLYDMYNRLYVLPTFGDVILEQLDADIIEDFEQELLELGRSPKFTKDVLSYFNMLLNFALKKKIITAKPYFEITIKKEPKKPNYLDNEQRKQFIEHLREYEPMYFPIVYFTCVRVCEWGKSEPFNAKMWFLMLSIRMSMCVRVSILMVPLSQPRREAIAKCH